MQEFLSNTPVQIRIDLAKKRGIIKYKYPPNVTDR